MSIKTFFINSTVASYNEDEFAWFQSLILNEGVIGDAVTGALGLGVTQTPVADMSVKVAIGKALVSLTKSGRTFKVVIDNNAEISVTIPANVSGSNRVDAIIVRVDKDADPDISKTNITTIERVAGTSAVALTDGAINTAVGNDGWYRLANVTVTNGDVAIITAEIADTRAKVGFSNGLAFSSVMPSGAVVPYGAATAPSSWLLCDGAAISRTTYSDLFAIIGTTYGVGDGSTTFNVPNLKGRFPLGYSASAPTKVLTFASRSSNTITITGADNHANNELQTGQAVLYSAPSGAMTGLTHNTTYYLIRVTATTFQLATTRANANAGTPITLSSDGTGAQTFTATYTARPLGQTGGEESHALRIDEMPAHTHSISKGIVGGSYDWGGSSDYHDVAPTTSGETGGSQAHNNMPPFLVMNYIIKT